MSIECDLTISFGSAGNSLAFLGGGWARSEANFTWSIGGESHLVLPVPAVGDEYVLTLDLVPFVHPPHLPSQRLSVSVNDVSLSAAELSRPTLLGYRFPASLLAQPERIVVTLRHPNAARPNDLADSADDRWLAFAASEAKLYRITPPEGQAATDLPTGLMLGAGTDDRSGPSGPRDLEAWAVRRTGLAISDLAMQFESLGENCEFGLFQRRCDAEPLGLLRFSSTFMRNLIRGIDNGFAGLGASEDIEPRLEGDTRREYMIHEKKYGLVYHTFVYEGQRSIWLMREQESARLKFLLRKFMEELHAAEKIFVYQRNVSVTEQEVLPLYMALNRYGDNTLLWVVPAEPNRPAGTVEVVMPGLLKGYIDRFAPDHNAHDLSFGGWLSVCANAYALQRLCKPSLAKPGLGQPGLGRPAPMHRDH